MPIYDQSYRRMEGRRRTARLRFLPIAGVGVRLFFQKKRFVLLGLLGLAPLAVGMFLILLPHLTAQFAAEIMREMGPLVRRLTHVNGNNLYVYLTNGYSDAFRVLFTMLVGGGLIANDLRTNALEIYFSRPVTRFDYFLGKLLVIVSILLMLSLAPCLVLWLTDVLLAQEEGFVQGQLHLLPRLAGATLLLSVPYALLMLALSALSSTARGAMVLYAGVVLMTLPIAVILHQALEQEAWHLINLDLVLERLVADLLGVDPTELVGPVSSVPLQGDAGQLAPWVLLALATACTLVFFRRVRAVEVVAG